MGMPMAASRYRSLIVSSGTEKISEESRRKLIMAMLAAIYPITKGSTFLRLSSCQNRDSRFGIFGILVCGWLLQVTHFQLTSQIEGIP